MPQRRRGPQAFRAVPGIRLLVTDFVLPGEDGAELAIALRKADRELRVVFISGYAQPHENGAALKDAALPEKPFSPAQLLEMVRESLSPGRVG